MGLLAVMLVVLAACAGTDARSGAAAGADATRTSSEAVRSSETPSAADAETRVVTDHAGREIEVPAAPAEVIGMHFPSTANLLALGLVPVAANEGISENFDGLGEYLPADLDLRSLPTYGNAYSPDLEAIANVDPELIVGNEAMEDSYSALSEIAPTVLVARPSNAAWRQRFLDVAGAVGRGEEADKIEADYERFIESLPDDLRDMIVVFIRPGETNFRIDSVETGFAGSVLADAGIPALDPEGVGELDEGSGYLSVSSERLGVVEDADVIVVPEGDIEQFLANPLADELPAVQEGSVLELPYGIYNGGHHYAAEALLRALADVGETS